MPCSHQGFRSISSGYERRRRVLIFFWTCERCGERLGEAGRTSYRPQFEPRGNDPYLATGR